MMGKLLLFIVYFMSWVGLAAQVNTISVPKIDHFDPYFEENGNSIYDFILKTVVQQPGLKLVERETFDKVLEEQERQKNEGFIDGETVAQGKLVGAQLMLIPTYNQEARTLNLSLRNLGTGEISCLYSYPLEEYKPNDQISEKLYELIQADIVACLAPLKSVTSATIAEVLEEKSGKARRLLCYTEDSSPLNKGDIITVYRLVPKTIGGKQVDYEEQVGSAKINEIENVNFFNVSVKLGGKEIAGFLAQNITLYAKL